LPKTRLAGYTYVADNMALGSANVTQLAPKADVMSEIMLNE